MQTIIRQVSKEILLSEPTLQTSDLNVYRHQPLEKII